MLCPRLVVRIDDFKLTEYDKTFQSAERGHHIHFMHPENIVAFTPFDLHLIARNGHEPLHVGVGCSVVVAHCAIQVGKQHCLLSMDTRTTAFSHSIRLPFTAGLKSLARISGPPYPTQNVKRAVLQRSEAGTCCPLP